MTEPATHAAEQLLPVLTPAHTAQLLDLTLEQLSQHRHNHTGPEYHRIGHGAVRYNTTAALTWRHRSPTPPLPPEGPTP